MINKLKKYQDKRNFNKTNEPKGEDKKGDKKSSLIFAIQHHYSRREHYDLRLEWEGVLLSWAVPKGPSYNPKDKRLAVKVEDHPLDYADFEGTIPKGEYGGGTVMLWDYGTWQPLADFKAGLKNGSLKFEVNGQRIKGKWALVKLKVKEGEDDDNWLLIKENDEYDKNDGGISHFDTSISTDRTIEQISKNEKVKNIKNPFSKAEVQLASLVDDIPKGKDYLFEVKYDGYRILAFIEKGKTKLFSRNGYDYSSKFPSVIKALNCVANNRCMVLDGEMIVTDETGRSDFQGLQNYIKSPTDKSPSYVVFDLLALDGVDLREQLLLERKEKLKKVLMNSPFEICYSEHVIGHGEKSLKAAEKLGLEGIIGKRINSPYIGTRNDDWIKIKCYKRQEFVIGGYTLTDKKLTGFSALLLAVYENKKLIYAGRVGTGFDEKSIKEMEKTFKPLRTEAPTFLDMPKTKERVFWLKPKLVAEIQFVEWTQENHLRQSSFKGLREDKKASEVVREMPRSEIKIDKEKERKISKKSKNNDELIIKGVEISSPNKIVYKDKKITKLDVINYYSLVCERMMKYTKNRVLSVVRCHNGIGGGCFYKKHPITKSLGVITLPVTNSEGKTDDYFYLESASGLISEAQLGTIEFHTWGSTIENLEKPDMMVFDLDPDEIISLSQVRQGVKDLKKILMQLSLKSYLKTSGGKGYHVVVPLLPSVPWDVFHDFAKQVAILMEVKWPERYTSNIRKINRKGKIFIDWVRNARGATSVAPYSLRARQGAKVSMPILWSELDKIAPNGIDMEESLKRLKKPDPWKGFFETNQKLK